ncbi:MAG TPA: hypothetical protein PKY50_09255 [Candidatus Competibacter sp.]|nr:hypothetical protein [Candidatus Competibacter sp.]
MKMIIKAGLLAFFVGSAIAMPAQDAEAYTRCRTVHKHGVYKKVCTTKPAYRYRTVCKNYWRHGVKYRSCRKVKVYR